MATLAESVAATGAAVVLRGGRYIASATGTLSGATVKVQYREEDGTTWTDICTFSALPQTYGTPILVGDGTAVRLFISGGPPSGVSAFMRQVAA